MVRGDAVRVTPSGDGPVVVAVERVPDLPAPTGCLLLLYVFAPCLEGFQTAAGAPLVLFGFLDRILPPGGTVKYDLLSAFPDFPSGTTSMVELSNPTVVEATVREDVLTIASTGGGTTTVSVTATAPDGRREVRSFRVTAERTAANSYWGGWRSVLLKSPPSEDGNQP